VTDGRTNGRTDGHICRSIYSACKAMLSLAVKPEFAYTYTDIYIYSVLRYMAVECKVYAHTIKIKPHKQRRNITDNLQNYIVNLVPVLCL